MAGNEEVLTAIQQVQREADAAIQRVKNDLTRLNSRVDQLQQQAGTNTDGAVPQDVLSELDALKNKLAALDPSDPTVLTAGDGGPNPTGG